MIIGVVLAASGLMLVLAVVLSSITLALRGSTLRRSHDEWQRLQEARAMLLQAASSSSTTVSQAATVQRAADEAAASQFFSSFAGRGVGSIIPISSVGSSLSQLLFPKLLENLGFTDVDDIIFGLSFDTRSVVYAFDQAPVYPLVNREDPTYAKIVPPIPQSLFPYMHQQNSASYVSLRMIPEFRIISMTEDKRLTEARIAWSCEITQGDDYSGTLIRDIYNPNAVVVDGRGASKISPTAGFTQWDADNGATMEPDWDTNLPDVSFL